LTHISHQTKHFWNCAGSGTVTPLIHCEFLAKRAVENYKLSTLVRGNALSRFPQLQNDLDDRCAFLLWQNERCAGLQKTIGETFQA
jgi:hypothetical protein